MRVRDAALALAVVAGAILAVMMAWAVDWLACENPGSEACGRAGLARAQLVVALGGLLPVAMFVRALWRRDHPWAWIWLGAGAATYLAWGVLNDAAVHGWDDLKVFTLS